MTTEILICEKEAALYGADLSARFPAIVFHAVKTVPEALPRCAQAQAIIGLAHEITPDLVAAMPRLRWIQALTTGTDTLTAQPGIRPEVAITSGRGIHGPQMSELAFLHMLALSRDFRRMLENQRSAHWNRWPQRLLLDKTAVLLGVGTISEELAVRCKAFGMRTIGISDHRTTAIGFDVLQPRAQLLEAIKDADFLIVLVPYSSETHHMVNARVLAALPSRAIVINIARGNVIDEFALIEAVRGKRIAGAGLDVFATEPLPSDSPIWHLDNVIVTPHVGGMSDVYAQQILPLVAENVGHFLANTLDNMRNLVQR